MVRASSRNSTLGSAGRIEILRGPFSALYGNSSGGVIAIFTEDAQPGHLLDGTAEYGSFNTQREALKAEGDDGAMNYVVDAAHFQTDGYRFHSNAERNNFNSKVRIALTDTSKLTVVANVIDTPFVQDPLGLTRTQLAQDPRQAGVGAVPFNTRKSLDQEQLGLTTTANGAPPRSCRRRSIRAIAPRRSSRRSRARRS